MSYFLSDPCRSHVVIVTKRKYTIMLFQTGVCPHGHYCPLGTGFPYTYPCQAGQYRNNTLGQSGEVCVFCPSRHYCDRMGTHTPLVCPQVGISSKCEELCCMDEKISFSLLPLCNRASTVQKALLLLNRVLKEPTVHVQLSVMGLSVPLVAEASTAVAWDS